ncbi:MAG: tRNA (adenosine(37)-N6)-threonylcarbamoyltransferase complex ATPase subunit type 1 TsaE [Chloroflexi bacterium]|nr:MAG: tRNA (adenosine(37)-N6)-threonylcarbamoyltransferase complex ATPase subunit type 1 TsaE [Chloroflexota bacterium]
MIAIESDQKMKEFGEKIGRTFRGGECIELVGDVGAGKTTLTKGIAKGLSIDEPIQSPTFTVNRMYEARDGLTLAHYDFYRLHDAGIMANELDEVANDPNTVTVIEWSGVVQDVLPADRLTFTITPTDEASRNVELIAGGNRSRIIKEQLV